MTFINFFNRKYESYEFPYFVPKEELAYNLEYVRMMQDENWIPRIWKKINDSNADNRQIEADKIIEHGGFILEICAGPAGGFMPIILNTDYQAKIMINDLCPTVLREWKKLFDSMQRPPENVEYAAFDICDIPFYDNSIDVVSGYSAIINIEGGNKRKALSEIYRVLKPGGLFVFSDQYVSQDYLNSMSLDLQRSFMDHYSDIFNDYQSDLEDIKFSNIETVIKGLWSNKDDHSTLAEFTRKHNTELIFTQYTKFCTK